MLPDRHIGFSRGRSGDLVFPTLSEHSTVYCDPHKGFGIVNKAEIDVFLELSCFFDDLVDVGNLVSGSSAFSKSSLNIWKFTVHVLLKPGLIFFRIEYSGLISFRIDCFYLLAVQGTLKNLHKHHSSKALILWR